MSIPFIEKPTTIAKAVGIRTITISADAIAGSSLGFRGSVLPFLSPGNAALANYNCLKSGPNPSFGACAANPTTGNFGLMDFYMYGNADFGYTARCTGDTQGRLVTNIARGIDHPLGTHDDGPSGVGEDRPEQANCPNFNAEPNIVSSQTGVGSQLEDGMLYGDNTYTSPTTSYPGRIQVTSGGTLVRNAQGGTPASRVDNTPLWSFLLDDGSLGLTPCDPDTVDTPAEMVDCIAWAKNPDPILNAPPRIVFDDDLGTSIRFGFTPSMWEPTILPGGSDYHIKSFLPVYIDTTFFACNNNGCDIMHTPGVDDTGPCPNNPANSRITCGTPGPGNRALDGVSAYILSLDIVPDNARSPSPGAANQLRFSLIE